MDKTNGNRSDYVMDIRGIQKHPIKLTSYRSLVHSRLTTLFYWCPFHRDKQKHHNSLEFQNFLNILDLPQPLLSVPIC